MTMINDIFVETMIVGFVIATCFAAVIALAVYVSRLDKDSATDNNE